MVVAWYDCDAFGVAGSAINNLGNSYADLGRDADAVTLFESALELRRRVLPEDHPHIGAVDG